jgi:hypothetical protein
MNESDLVCTLAYILMDPESSWNQSEISPKIQSLKSIKKFTA